MKVRKSNNKPLKRSASFTSGAKTGSKSAKSIGSGSKSMKSTKSSSKSYKKIYEEFSDSEYSDNESSNSEISDNDELSDNKSSDDDESSDDNETSDDDGSDDDESDDNVYEDNDIRNIIIEDINDNYSKGKFGNFHVIIMKKNGYMNATKLCDNISNKYKNKKFKHWNENKNSKELIEELSSSAGIPADELIYNITGGKITELRGTYVHPKLIIHIASWCNPEYAIKVSEIVLSYHAKEAIREKEKLLQKKNDKIDELSRKIDKQTKIMKNQTNMMKDQKSTIKEQDKKINELLSKSNEVLGYAKDTNRKITHVVKERVPYSDEPKIEHQFIIMKNNDEPIKPKKGESPKKIYDYTALRIMNKSKSSTMNRYFKDHPDGETILTIDYTPNAMHLWNQCKKELIEDDKIKSSGTSSSSFNLKKGYSENKLKKDIKRIHNLRLKHPE